MREAEGEATVEFRDDRHAFHAALPLLFSLSSRDRRFKERYHTAFAAEAGAATPPIRRHAEIHCLPICHITPAICAAVTRVTRHAFIEIDSRRLSSFDVIARPLLLIFSSFFAFDERAACHASRDTSFRFSPANAAFFVYDILRHKMIFDD